MELDERTRLEARHVFADGTTLLRCGSAEGYAALGLVGDGDAVHLDGDDWSLAGSTEPLDDAVVFGASGRAVAEVTVGGRRIVEDGRVRDAETIRQRYESTRRQLLEG